MRVTWRAHSQETQCQYSQLSDEQVWAPWRMSGTKRVSVWPVCPDLFRGLLIDKDFIFITSTYNATTTRHRRLSV